MRFLTLTAFVAILAPASSLRSHAQDSPIRQGVVQVAGTARFTRTRDIGNDHAWTTFEVAPRVGYFVLSGLAVNANLRFQRIADGDNHVTEWGVGPGLTYYFNISSRHFYPFLSGRTLFTWARSGAGPGGSAIVKDTNRAWLASAGGLFMVGQHVGITGEIFYEHETFTSQMGTAAKLANSAESYGLQWGVAAFVF